MRTATITETKNHFSALIEAVRHGETVIVLDRTTPVACIEGIPSTGDGITANRMDELQRKGLLLKPRQRNLETILQEAPVRPRNKVGVVQALIRDREEGR